MSSRGDILRLLPARAQGRSVRRLASSCAGRRVPPRESDKVSHRCHLPCRRRLPRHGFVTPQLREGAEAVAQVSDLRILRSSSESRSTAPAVTEGLHGFQLSCCHVSYCQSRLPDLSLSKPHSKEKILEWKIRNSNIEIRNKFKIPMGKCSKLVCILIFCLEFCVLVI